MFFSRKVGKKGNCPIFRRLVCLWKDLFLLEEVVCFLFWFSFFFFFFCEMWFLGCLFILFFFFFFWVSLCWIPKCKLSKIK